MKKKLQKTYLHQQQKKSMTKNLKKCLYTIQKKNTNKQIYIHIYIKMYMFMYKNNN